MKTIFMDLWKDKSGVTAIEYGLIAGLMSAVLVVLSDFLAISLKICLRLFPASWKKRQKTLLMKRKINRAVI
ncbi:MAG: Flp family type IVb pilin [Deltaproteobacteria bacterium]|nr:Flp family type IVb pilin [Deltaproteobacteria bacterium]